MVEGNEQRQRKLLSLVPSPPSAHENVLVAGVGWGGGGVRKWGWNPAVFCLRTLDSSLTSGGLQFLHL